MTMDTVNRVCDAHVFLEWVMEVGHEPLIDDGDTLRMLNVYNILYNKSNNFKGPVSYDFNDNSTIERGRLDCNCGEE